MSSIRSADRIRSPVEYSSSSFMAREVERLNEEIIDLQRSNKTLLSENQKLRKEIESEGELKESYFQVY